MPIVARDPNRFVGQVAGDGHCVALCRAAAGAPPTRHWRRGAMVRAIAPPDFGTLIATFDRDGFYGNHRDGRSHCAILFSVTAQGLIVLDQWLGRAAALRTIRFKGGAGPAVDDADAYAVIELADEATA